MVRRRRKKENYYRSGGVGTGVENVVRSDIRGVRGQNARGDKKVERPDGA